MLSPAFFDDLGAASEGLANTTANVPASALVYNELHNRIISLDLPPETVLARAELAETFKVSQSPVREAITRLEQDGLVISYPQSKTLVTKIDEARIREDHFLRSSVECEVARRLAEQDDKGALQKARGILKMAEAVVDDVEQVDLFRKLDAAFHEALFAGVGQTQLNRHIRARCGHLGRIRSLDLPRKEKMASVLEQHTEILNAIETGVGDQAAKVMRDHLSHTIKRLLEIMDKYNELFIRI